MTSDFSPRFFPPTFFIAEFQRTASALIVLLLVSLRVRPRGPTKEREGARLVQPLASERLTRLRKLLK